MISISGFMNLDNELKLTLEYSKTRLQSNIYMCFWQKIATKIFNFPPRLESAWKKGEVGVETHLCFHSQGS